MRYSSRATVLSLLVASLCFVPAAWARDPSLAFTYIGQTTFPTNTTYNGTQIGGLSGIDYIGGNSFVAVSDDRSQINPARFYSLNIDLSDGALNNGDISFTGVTTLTRPDGTTFPALSLDPEDIVRDPLGNGYYISSEGDRGNNIQPFINRFGTNGQQNQALPIPAPFQIDLANGTGVRNNLAFESLTVTPDGSTLVTATENALLQDGPDSTLSSSSNARILTYNLASATAGAQFVYNVAPVVESPNPAGNFTTNGLVDLLALSNNRFLALERSFSVGAPGGGGTGYTVKIFEIDTTGATDVSGITDLDAFVGAIVPVQKTLVLDFATLGIPLDNIEGLTFGPTLANGDRSLIVASDNNFAGNQFTQFAAFRVTAVPEAGTASLLIPGLIGLAGITIALRRRK